MLKVIFSFLRLFIGIIIFLPIIIYALLIKNNRP